MQNQKRSITRQFIYTCVIFGILLLLEAALVLGCILRPEIRALPLLAGVTVMWILVAASVIFYRIYQHCIKPCEETEKTCQMLSRGDFPPLLAPRPREFFPGLSRAVNLLRDRLQYLEGALRDRQKEETRLQQAGRGAALQARVYAQLLPRLYRPLALLGGYLELEKSGHALTMEQVKAASGQFAYGVQLLHRIIAGMHAGDASLPGEVFDLNVFLRGFDEESQAKLQRRKIGFSCSYGTDLPNMLYGNRQWLRWQLQALLHILFLDAENGGHMEFAIEGGGNVSFVFTDIRNNFLASEFFQSEADPELGEEIPMPLLELRLAASRAVEHHAELTVEMAGEHGTCLKLSLGPQWSDLPPGVSRGMGSRFAESDRRSTLPQLYGPSFSGPFPVIVRGPETVDILRAWHPQIQWLQVDLAGPMPEGSFQRLLAIVPVESSNRYLQRMGTILSRAAMTGTAVTVIDPGMHIRFRQQLRQSGIREIYDSRLVYREFGASEEEDA